MCSMTNSQKIIYDMCWTSITRYVRAHLENVFLQKCFARRLQILYCFDLEP